MKRVILLLLSISLFTSGCGYSDSYVEEVRQNAFDAGYSAGEQAGYTSGYDEGKGDSSGYTAEDLSDSYNDGYEDGYADAEKELTPTKTELYGYDNGALTERQVKEMQVFWGLTADGYWGEKSQAFAGEANEAWQKYLKEKKAAEATASPSPSPKPSQSQTVSVTVYITNTGEKYHRSGCQYLSKSKIAISLSDAVLQGYTHCSRCY